MARKSKADIEQEIVAEVKKCYERGAGAEAENRRLFSEDLRFVYQDTIEADGQWDSAILLARRGRPSYTFNRVIGAVNLVLGDQRQTRPQVRVRAANKDASAETATILNGLVRDIEQCSGAESIYDSQFKFAVAGGYGAWRIVPEYEDDSSFDQVLRIKDIPNPLTVLWDPEATCPCRSDAMWALVAERISIDKYKALYPDADYESLQFSRDSRGWATDNEVRIAEYFKKVPVTKTIALLTDGRVVEYTPQEREIEAHLAEQHPDGNYNKIEKTRQVKTWQVEWYLVDGKQILAGPIKYDWKRIPVVRLPGRCINIEGKQKTQSLIRHTKDPQRTYNYHRSTMVELAALTPRAPYIATPKMVKGYEDMWATANTNARPYLLYDPDPDVPGERPTREPPPDVPQAMIALSQADLNDIQAATGYFDASLGQEQDQGDRTSGKALLARQRKSDLGSYEFIDNFGKALKITWEMCLNMIPATYDTKRVVRVIGQDNVEKYETLNNTDDKGLMSSLKDGAYDCTVTIGPSYQTARQESLATLMDLAGVMPQLVQFAPDILVKNIDIPDADELVRRLRIPLIQQGIVQPTSEEQKNLPPKPQPDPMQTAELQIAQARAQKEGHNAVVAQSKANSAPLEHIKLADSIVHDRFNTILTAKQAGIDNAQGQVDLQQSQLEGQQNLQQSQAEGQQSLQQSNQEHQQGLQQAQEQHVQGLQQSNQEHQLGLIHQHVEHAQSVMHTEHDHQQKTAHTEVANKQKLELAKKQAAMKPKPAGKK